MGDEANLNVDGRISLHTSYSKAWSGWGYSMPYTNHRSLSECTTGTNGRDTSCRNGRVDSKAVPVSDGFALGQTYHGFWYLRNTA